MKEEPAFEYLTFSTTVLHFQPTHLSKEHVVRQFLRAQDDNVKMLEQLVPVLRGKLNTRIRYVTPINHIQGTHSKIWRNPSWYTQQDAIIHHVARSGCPNFFCNSAHISGLSRQYHQNIMKGLILKVSRRKCDTKIPSLQNPL